MSLTLKTLGRLEIEWQGQTVSDLRLRKSQALLIYLALNPGRQDRSRLAGLLWGHLPEAKARRNLRHALHGLRRALEPEALDGDRLAVGLNPGIGLGVDAIDLEAAFARAGRCRRAGDPTAAVEHLEAAVALYAGDFLSGFEVVDCREFEEWAAARQVRLRELALEALDALAAHWMRHGAHERALGHARRLLELEPLWEKSHRLTMTLLALTGQRSAALLQYERCRLLLAAELGVEPLEETTALYERIKGPGEKETGESGNRAAPSAQFPNLSTLQATHAPTIQLPFVGRAEEHAALVSFWEAAQCGRGQMALVAGEAGVGKTRLLDEVLRYAEAQGTAVLRGRCYEFGGGLPYQPIAEALRGHLEVGGQRLRAPNLPPVWLAELACLLPELSQAFPDLPTAPSLAAEAARQRLFEAVARALRAAAPPRSGICLFLDDVHWADQSTLDLLHYLVRRLAGTRAWLVGAYRPEETATAHPLTRLRQGLSRDGQVAHLVLERLSAGSVRALARTLTGDGGGDALGELLYHESEGNAFLLSEIVSGLQERGLLSGEKAAIEGWQSLPAAERLPPRVQDMILQRVGRLTRPARRLLRLAATAGRQFDHLLLQAAGRLDAEQVDECLEEWLARHLVAPLPGRGGPGPRAGPAAAAYDLAHDKIRAAIYGALPPSQRQDLHLAVGQGLEIVHRDDLARAYEALAYHFERAGAAERALAYLPLAAAKAAAVYANEQALDYYRRALALCPGADGRRWPLLLQQADVLRLVGQYDAAIDACRQVVDEGPAEWQARAASGLAQVHRIRRDYTAARHWARESERLARGAAPGEDAPGAGEKARALQALGEIEREQANLARAGELFEAALARYEQAGDIGGQAKCLKGLGDTLCASGRYARARQRYEQAAAIFRELDDKQSASTCLRGIAVASWRLKDHNTSRQATLESLAISRAIGDRQGEAAALNNLGLSALVDGDYGQTQRHLEASVAIFRQLGLEKRTASGLHNLGIAYLDEDLSTARRCLEQALAINRAAGARRDQALDLGWLGVVHWRLGDHAAAADCLDRALDLDRELGGGEEQGWHLLWGAAVACERRDLPAARHYLQQAAELVARGRGNVKAYEVIRWRAGIHLAEGDTETARRLARQALVEAEAAAAGPDMMGAISSLLGRCYAAGPGADDEQATHHFQQALALLPDAAPTRYARATALQHYGRYLADRDRSDEADACQEEARQILARCRNVPA